MSVHILCPDREEVGVGVGIQMGHAASGGAFDRELRVRVFKCGCACTLVTTFSCCFCSWRPSKFGVSLGCLRRAAARIKFTIGHILPVR